MFSGVFGLFFNKLLWPDPRTLLIRGSFEMLEPRDGKLSRGVLRGEWGREVPALPGVVTVSMNK